jgi:hypothetical protein
MRTFLAIPADIDALRAAAQEPLPFSAQPGTVQTIRMQLTQQLSVNAARPGKILHGAKLHIHTVIPDNSAEFPGMLVSFFR